MHLLPRLRASNTTELGTTFVNSSGTPFATFLASTGENSFTAEYEVLRADLAALFVQASQERGGAVQYVYGESIAGLTQDKDSIEVSFASGARERERYDLVVAADGATSTTRPMILDAGVLADSYRFIGQYIAFFSIPAREGDPRMWQWYNASRGRGLMMRPHRTGGTRGAYLCVTMPKKELRDGRIEAAMDGGVEAQKKILHEYLNGAGWESERILKGMDEAEDFYMSRAAQVMLPKWTNGRACVLGDTAHATFGVGTTLAIEGAYFLAGEISKCKDSSDVPRALERFEEVFRPLYAKSEGLPPGYPQIAFPQTWWGLGVQKALLWFVTRTKLYKLLQGQENGKGYEVPDYDWKEAK